MSAQARFPLTVFYDASCAMCVTEMEALKRLDANENVTLVDCSSPVFADEQAANAGVSRSDMMTLIHARDANGRWLVGVDCFEVLYREVGLEWAARFWGTPVLRGFLMAFYAWVARHRQVLSRLGINALVRLLIPKPSL